MANLHLTKSSSPLIAWFREALVEAGLSKSIGEDWENTYRKSEKTFTGTDDFGQRGHLLEMADLQQQPAAQALLLLQALQSGADIGQKITLLHQFHELTKREPALLPTFFPIILGLATDPSPDLRMGLVRLTEDTVCRMLVLDEYKALVSARGIEVLKYLMTDVNPNVTKRIIRCATSIYPFLFKWICKLPTEPLLWQSIADLKLSIFAMLQHPNDGVKVCVVRFLHRLIVVQSAKDPSVQVTGIDAFSIEMCPPQHPFVNPQELVAEGVGLFHRMQSYLSTVGIAAGPNTANLNCMLTLAKSRPQYIPAIINSLSDWAKRADSHLTPFQQRSVQRAVKIVLVGIYRLPAAPPIEDSIINIVTNLGAKSYEIQQLRRQGLKRTSATVSMDDEAVDVKRQRVEQQPGEDRNWNADEVAALSSSVLQTVDLRTLQAAIVTELAIQIIKACPQSRWSDGIARYKRAMGIPSDDTSSVPPKSEPGQTTNIDTTPPVAEPEQPDQVESSIPIEDDISDTIDVGDNPALEQAVTLDILKMDLPPLAPDEQRALAHESLKRIFEYESEVKLPLAIMPSTSSAPNKSSTNVITPPHTVSAGKNGWMLVVSRLSTLLSSGSDATVEIPESAGAPNTKTKNTKRYIAELLSQDFKERIEAIVTWLHHVWLEEHKEDSITGDSSSDQGYTYWVIHFLEVAKRSLDPKDKTFAKFLIEIPEVNSEVIDRIKSFCEDPEWMQLGLFTIQGMMNHRPAVRSICFDLLLEYTSHPAKLTRSTAIVMSKRLFTDHPTIGPKVQERAVEMLKQLLEPPPPRSEMDTKPESDVPSISTEENGVPLPSEIKSEDEKPETAEGDWTEDEVVQRIELYFALCSKNHDLLLQLFEMYKTFQPAVQRAIRTHIQPLLVALSSHPGRLYPLIRNFPAGSDALILRTINILCERPEGPSTELVNTVKSVFRKRKLNARFILPIIGSLDKGEALQFLPRIVILLDGTEQTRSLVKDAFLKIMGRDSGQPRDAAGSKLSPSDLLINLHNMEETVGLKRAVEGTSMQKHQFESIHRAHSLNYLATTICFTSQDIFTQEVLAVVLQQLVEQSTLPTLYLRSVIQSVSQYPGLNSFVMNILVKLINKKVWTMPKLWDGFVRCLTVRFHLDFRILFAFSRPRGGL
ncbi:hypothetical protein DFS34DRAFT_450715 [Phlyctochytrium arcticum]|nr:hypothetical protein DFS34DRAFT_450715 [Phlyctochytrium arcticum]